MRTKISLLTAALIGLSTLPALADFEVIRPTTPTNITDTDIYQNTIQIINQNYTGNSLNTYGKEAWVDVHLNGAYTLTLGKIDGLSETAKVTGTWYRSSDMQAPYNNFPYYYANASAWNKTLGGTVKDLGTGPTSIRLSNGATLVGTSKEYDKYKYDKETMASIGNQGTLQIVLNDNTFRSWIPNTTPYEYDRKTQEGTDWNWGGGNNIELIIKNSGGIIEFVQSDGSRLGNAQTHLTSLMGMKSNIDLRGVSVVGDVLQYAGSSQKMIFASGEGVGNLNDKDKSGADYIADSRFYGGVIQTSSVNELFGGASHPDAAMFMHIEERFNKENLLLSQNGIWFVGDKSHSFQPGKVSGTNTISIATSNMEGLKNVPTEERNAIYGDNQVNFVNAGAIDGSLFDAWLIMGRPGNWEGQNRFHIVGTSIIGDIDGYAQHQAFGYLGNLADAYQKNPRLDLKVVFDNRDDEALRGKTDGYGLITDEKNYLQIAKSKMDGNLILTDKNKLNLQFLGLGSHAFTTEGGKTITGGNKGSTYVFDNSFDTNGHNFSYDAIKDAKGTMYILNSTIKLGVREASGSVGDTADWWKTYVARTNIITQNGTNFKGLAADTASLTKFVFGDQYFDGIVGTDEEFGDTIGGKTMTEYVKDGFDSRGYTLRNESDVNRNDIGSYVSTSNIGSQNDGIRKDISFLFQQGHFTVDQSRESDVNFINANRAYLGTIAGGTDESIYRFKNAGYLRYNQVEQALGKIELDNTKILDWIIGNYNLTAQASLNLSNSLDNVFKSYPIVAGNADRRQLEFDMTNVRDHNPNLVGSNVYIAGQAQGAEYTIWNLKSNSGGAMSTSASGIISHDRTQTRSYTDSILGVLANAGIIFDHAAGLAPKVGIDPNTNQLTDLGNATDDTKFTFRGSSMAGDLRVDKYALDLEFDNSDGPKDSTIFGNAYEKSTYTGNSIDFRGNSNAQSLSFIGAGSVNTTNANKMVDVYAGEGALSLKLLNTGANGINFITNTQMNESGTLQVENSTFGADYLVFGATNQVATTPFFIRNDAPGVTTRLGILDPGAIYRDNAPISLRFGSQIDGGGLVSTSTLKGNYDSVITNAVGNQKVTNIVLHGAVAANATDANSNTIEVRANNSGGIIELVYGDGSDNYTRAGKTNSNQVARLGSQSVIDLRGTSLVGDVITRHGTYVRAVFASGAGAEKLNSTTAGADYIADSKYYGGVLTGTHNVGTSVAANPNFIYGDKTTQNQGYWFVGADSHNFQNGKVNAYNTITTFDHNNNDWRGWSSFRFINAGDVDSKLFNSWRVALTQSSGAGNEFYLVGTSILGDINGNNKNNTLDYWNTDQANGTLYTINATFDARTTGRGSTDGFGLIENAQNNLAVAESKLTGSINLLSNQAAKILFRGTGSHAFNTAGQKTITNKNASSYFVFDSAFARTENDISLNALKNAGGNVVVLNNNLSLKYDNGGAKGTPTTQPATNNTLANIYVARTNITLADGQKFFGLDSNSYGTGAKTTKFIFGNAYESGSLPNIPGLTIDNKDLESFISTGYGTYTLRNENATATNAAQSTASIGETGDNIKKDIVFAFKNGTFDKNSQGYTGAILGGTNDSVYRFVNAGYLNQAQIEDALGSMQLINTIIKGWVLGQSNKTAQTDLDLTMSDASGNYPLIVGNAANRRVSFDFTNRANLTPKGADDKIFVAGTAQNAQYTIYNLKDSGANGDPTKGVSTTAQNVAAHKGNTTKDYNNTILGVLANAGIYFDNLGDTTADNTLIKSGTDINAAADNTKFTLRGSSIKGNLVESKYSLDLAFDGAIDPATAGATPYDNAIQSATMSADVIDFTGNAQAQALSFKNNALKTNGADSVVLTPGTGKLNLTLHNNTALLELNQTANQKLAAGSSINVLNSNFKAEQIISQNLNNSGQNGNIFIRNETAGTKASLGLLDIGTNTQNTQISLRFNNGATLESLGSIQGNYGADINNSLNGKQVTSIVMNQTKPNNNNENTTNYIDIKAINSGGIIELVAKSNSGYSRAGKTANNQAARLASGASINLRGVSLVGDIVARHGTYLRGVFASGEGIGNLNDKTKAGADYIADSKHYGGVIQAAHMGGDLEGDKMSGINYDLGMEQGFWFIGSNSHNYKNGKVDENNTITLFDGNNDKWRGYSTFRFVNADSVDAKLFNSWGSNSNTVKLDAGNNFMLAGTSILGDINATINSNTLGYWSKYANNGAKWNLTATFDMRDVDRGKTDAFSLLTDGNNFLDVNKSKMTGSLALGPNATANLIFRGLGSHAFTKEGAKTITGGSGNGSANTFIFDDAFGAGNSFNYNALKDVNGKTYIVNSTLDLNFTGTPQNENLNDKIRVAGTSIVIADDMNFTRLAADSAQNEFIFGNVYDARIFNTPTLFLDSKVLDIYVAGLDKNVTLRTASTATDATKNAATSTANIGYENDNLTKKISFVFKEDTFEINETKRADSTTYQDFATKQSGYTGTITGGTTESLYRFVNAGYINNSQIEDAIGFIDPVGQTKIINWVLGNANKFAGANVDLSANPASQSRPDFIVGNASDRNVVIDLTNKEHTPANALENLYIGGASENAQYTIYNLKESFSKRDSNADEDRDGSGVGIATTATDVISKNGAKKTYSESILGALANAGVIFDHFDANATADGVIKAGTDLNATLAGTKFIFRGSSFAGNIVENNFSLDLAFDSTINAKGVTPGDKDIQTSSFVGDKISLAENNYSQTLSFKGADSLKGSNGDSVTLVAGTGKLDLSLSDVNTELVLDTNDTRRLGNESRLSFANSRFSGDVYADGNLTMSVENRTLQTSSAKHAIDIENNGTLRLTLKNQGDGNEFVIKTGQNNGLGAGSNIALSDSRLSGEVYAIGNLTYSATNAKRPVRDAELNTSIVIDNNATLALTLNNLATNETTYVSPVDTFGKLTINATNAGNLVFDKNITTLNAPTNAAGNVITITNTNVVADSIVLLNNNTSGATTAQGTGAIRIRNADGYTASLGYIQNGEHVSSGTRNNSVNNFISLRLGEHGLISTGELRADYGSAINESLADKNVTTIALSSGWFGTGDSDFNNFLEVKTNNSGGIIELVQLGRDGNAYRLGYYKDPNQTSGAESTPAFARVHSASNIDLKGTGLVGDIIATPGTYMRGIFASGEGSGDLNDKEIVGSDYIADSKYYGGVIVTTHNAGNKNHSEMSYGAKNAATQGFWFIGEDSHSFQSGKVDANNTILAFNGTATANNPGWSTIRFVNADNVDANLFSQFGSVANAQSGNGNVFELVGTNIVGDINATKKIKTFGFTSAHQNQAWDKYLGGNNGATWTLNATFDYRDEAELRGTTDAFGVIKNSANELEVAKTKFDGNLNLASNAAANMKFIGAGSHAFTEQGAKSISGGKVTNGKVASTFVFDNAFDESNTYTYEAIKNANGDIVIVNSNINNSLQSTGGSGQGTISYYFYNMGHVHTEDGTQKVMADLQNNYGVTLDVSKNSMLTGGFHNTGSQIVNAYFIGRVDANALLENVLVGGVGTTPNEKNTYTFVDSGVLDISGSVIDYSRMVDRKTLGFGSKIDGKDAGLAVEAIKAMGDTQLNAGIKHYAAENSGFSVEEDYLYYVGNVINEKPAEMANNLEYLRFVNIYDKKAGVRHDIELDFGGESHAPKLVVETNEYGIPMGRVEVVEKMLGYIQGANSDTNGNASRYVFSNLGTELVATNAFDSSVENLDGGVIKFTDMIESNATNSVEKTMRATEMGALQVALINAGVKFYVDGNDANKTGTIIGLRNTALNLGEHKLDSATDKKFGYDLAFSNSANLVGALNFAENNNTIALSFDGENSFSTDTLDLALGTGKNTIRVANVGRDTNKSVSVEGANIAKDSSVVLIDTNVTKLNLANAGENLKVEIENSNLSSDIEISRVGKNASVSVKDSALQNVNAQNIAQNANLSFVNTTMNALNIENIELESVVSINGGSVGNVTATNAADRLKLTFANTKAIGDIDLSNAHDGITLGVENAESLGEIKAANIGNSAIFSLSNIAQVGDINLSHAGSNAEVTLNKVKGGNLDVSSIAQGATISVADSKIDINAQDARAESKIFIANSSGALNAKNIAANALLDIRGSEVSLDISNMGEEAKLSFVDSKINNLGGNIAFRSEGAGSSLVAIGTDFVSEANATNLTAIDSKNAGDVISISGKSETDRSRVIANALDKYRVTAIATNGVLELENLDITASSAAGAVGVSFSGEQNATLRNVAISAKESFEPLGDKLVAFESNSTGSLSLEKVSAAITSSAKETRKAVAVNITNATGVDASFDRVSAQKPGAELVGVSISEINGSVNVGIANANINNTGGEDLREVVSATALYYKESTYNLANGVGSSFVLGNAVVEGEKTTAAEFEGVNNANIRVVGEVDSKGVESYGLRVSTNQVRALGENQVAIQNLGAINARIGAELTTTTAQYDLAQKAAIRMENDGVINAINTGGTSGSTSGDSANAAAQTPREVLVKGSGIVEFGNYATTLKNFNVDANRPFEVVNGSQAPAVVRFDGELKFNRINSISDFYIQDMVSVGGESAKLVDSNERNSSNSATKMASGNVLITQNAKVSTHIDHILKLSLDRDTGKVTTSVNAEHVPAAIMSKVAMATMDSQAQKLSREVANHVSMMANAGVNVKSGRNTRLKDKLAYGGGELIQIDVPIAMLSIESTRKTETFVSPYYSRSKLHASNLSGSTDASGFTFGLTHAFGDDNEYLVGVHAGMETRHGTSAIDGVNSNSSNVSTYIVGAHTRARLAKVGDDAVYVRGELNYIGGRATQGVSLSDASSTTADAPTKGFGGMAVVGYDKSLGEGKLLTGEVGAMIQQSVIGQTSMDLGVLFQSEQVKKTHSYGLANLRYSQAFGVGEYSFVPNVTAGIRALLGGNNYSTALKIGANSYRSNELMDRYTGMFSLGMNLIHLSDIFRVSLTYTGEFGHYMTTHSINGRVGVKF